jgi:hypothetical protein
MHHAIWTQLAPAVVKVAVYFILKANREPGEWYDGTGPVNIPRGSFITSYASIATACNISIQQARDACEHLDRTQFATYRRTHRWTLVSVVDYDTYQPPTSNGNKLENTLETGQRTTDKELKNKEHISASPDGDARVEPPSLEKTAATATDVRSSRKARNGGLTAQQEAWFNAWWAEYWRREAKQSASRAFAKHVLTEARFQQIMAATLAQRLAMLAKEARYRPHGATWLNGERWEDETSVTAVPAQSAGRVYEVPRKRSECP